MPALRGGAIEKIWHAFGREFARLGHEMTHISRRFPGLPDREVIDGVTHVRITGHDAPGSLLALKLFDLFYSLRALRVLPPGDILVTHTFWMPIIVRDESHGKVNVHIARYPKGQMRFYTHASRLQTVSRPILKAITTEVPRFANRVCSIPLPVVREATVDAPPFSGRRREILYVGRIHPEKGIHLLIEALLLLPAHLRAGWRLVIVGPSATNAGGGGEEYEARLKSLAQPLGEQLDWIGPIFQAAQLDEFYSRASLFVYPSLAELGETFGVAPLEAMACGCPALVSSLECFREFIDPDLDGFVFDHRVAEPAATLAERIAQLLRAPESLARTGELAFRKAQDFTVERIATLHLADFQSQCGPNKLA